MSIITATPATTIEAALAKAQAGDEIQCEPGIYPETLHSGLMRIPDGVTLRGASPGSVIVTINPKYPWTSMDLRGVKDFHVDGLSFRQGVRLADGAFGRLINCEVSSPFGNGVQLYTNNCYIYKCRIYDCAGHGIYVDGSENIIEYIEAFRCAEYGIHVHSGGDHIGCDGNCVAYSLSYQNKAGILIGSGKGNRAECCVAYENTQAGLMIDYDAIDNKILNCISARNGIGVQVGRYGAQGSEVKRNVVWDNRVHWDGSEFSPDNWMYHLAAAPFVAYPSDFHLKPDSGVPSDYGIYPAEPEPVVVPEPEPEPTSLPVPIPVTVRDLNLEELAVLFEKAATVVRALKDNPA